MKSFVSDNNSTICNKPIYVVEQYEKYNYLLSCPELDDKFHTTHLCLVNYKAAGSKVQPDGNNNRGKQLARHGY